MQTIKKRSGLNHFYQRSPLFQFGSSRPKVLFKKGVLENFAKFTAKHHCRSLFFNKLQAQACNFIKKETPTQLFSCEFCKNIFEQPILQNTSGGFIRFFSGKHTLKQKTIDLQFKSVDWFLYKCNICLFKVALEWFLCSPLSLAPR